MKESILFFKKKIDNFIYFFTKPTQMKQKPEN